MTRPLALWGSTIGEVRPDTDPASLVATLPQLQRIQFCEPLPPHLLSLLCESLRSYPEIWLLVHGRDLDPSLSFLHGFEYVRKLGVDMWHVESFEPLASFVDLVELGLGQTKSTQPSIDVVRNFPHLRSLGITGHSRGFEAVAELQELRRLSLQTSRVKSLASISSHPALENIILTFGSIRDLSPLATLPRLRDLSLTQIRLLNTDDLLPLSGAKNLEAVELRNLRNVTSLHGLGERPPIRFLCLDGLNNLATLEPLVSWPYLEYLNLTNSRPLDRSLRPLLNCPELKHVWVGAHFPEEEVRRFEESYRGETLWAWGRALRGSAPSWPYFWEVVRQLRGSSPKPFYDVHLAQG